MRTGKIFKDRDYILTQDNLYFCVVGYTHPEDRIIAYLKYTLAKPAKYRRALPFYTIPHVKNTLEYLKKRYPIYIYHDKINKINFSAVPLSKIKHHLCPEEKLANMLSKDAKDKLERKAIDLVMALSEHSNIPLRFFGVTGSILLGIHSLKYSDIDVTVYGRMNSQKVKDTLLHFYKNMDEFEKFSGYRLKSWCEDKVRLYPLTMTEAEEIYSRIWNRGIFNGTLFSVHPTRLDSEIKEEYGGKVVQPKGLIEIEATVKDSSQSIFTPSTLIIEDISIISGLEVDVKEILSFEGLYSGIFNEGDQIIVKGMLEKVKKVENKSRGSYWRIVVGSLTANGKDYVKFKS